MKLNKNILTEKDVFQGKKIVTINTEIPENLYNQIVNAHNDEVAAGKTSLTFEQFSGGLLSIGYNWTVYIGLKKLFDK